MAKSKKNVKKKKSKKTFYILLVIILVALIAVSAYFVISYYNGNNNNSNNNSGGNNNTNLPVELGDANETKYISWNDELNISKESIFYQYNKEEINEYYKYVNFSSSDEEIFITLFDLLKENQTKTNYDGKNPDYGLNITWANYCLTDRDYEEQNLTKEEVDSNKWIIDGANLDILYRRENIIFKQGVSGTIQKTDREHILPKSYGFNGSNDAYQKYFAGCDMHNLRVGESGGNQTGHNNRLYDDLNVNDSSVKEVVDPDGLSSSYYNDSLGLFMPQDEDKGEIARAVFYMATRYRYYEKSDALGNPSPAIRLEDNVKFMGSKTINPEDTMNNPAVYGMLQTLLKWNNEDPVSENEMIRNNLVYNLQGNRNPFVDFPNLANILFG